MSQRCLIRYFSLYGQPCIYLQQIVNCVSFLQYGNKDNLQSFQRFFTDGYVLGLVVLLIGDVYLHVRLDVYSTLSAIR